MFALIQFNCVFWLCIKEKVKNVVEIVNGLLLQLVEVSLWALFTWLLHSFIVNIQSLLHEVSQMLRTSLGGVYNGDNLHAEEDSISEFIDSSVLNICCE